MLGVTISHDERELIRKNYDSLIEKVKGILKIWSKRNLSLIGKINIVNTLVASLFVYKMMVLPNKPSTIIVQVEKDIELFLWNGHKPKVQMKVLQKPKTAGGLGLVCLKTKEAALKATWINILRNDVAGANLAYQNFAPVLQELIWDCKIAVEDVKTVVNPNDSRFWNNVLTAWSKVMDSQHETRHSDVIWYNSEIKIGNEIILWTKAFQNGLIYVDQLFREDNMPISFLIAQREFGLSIMQFNSLVSAIPKDIRKGHVRLNKHEHVIIARILYDRLLSDMEILDSKRKLWERDLNKSILREEYINSFKAIYKVTNVSKYRSFQYRLQVRGVVTNMHLFRWKITDSNLCTFCGKCKETYLHLFIYCEKVQTIWEYVEQFMLCFTDEQIHFQEDTVIWNRFIQNEGHIKNFMSSCKTIYRLGTVNSKSFVGKVLLRIKWNLN